jgi:hypothetical protein
LRCKPPRPYGQQTQAREAAGTQQKAADDLRRSGASEAATQAQRRADQYEAKAAQKPESLFEWLADVIFTSLLTPSGGSSQSKK